MDTSTNTLALALLAVVLLFQGGSSRILGDVPEVPLCEDHSANRTLEEDDGCLAIIKALSAYDAELSARVPIKKAAAAASETAHLFVSNTLMGTAGSSTGTSFSSEGTRCWVSEVYEGLGSQYTEYFYGSGGYLDINATEIFATFEATSLHQGRVLWHFRHRGIFEHDWIVEQMPNYEGYRVLQGYSQGYSLYAWLNGCDPGSMLGANELNRVLDNPGSMYMFFLSKLYVTNPDFELDINDPAGAVAALEGDFQIFAPYVEWILSTTDGLIMQYFQAAWDWLGKGQVHSKEEFLAYALKLNELVDYLYVMDNSTELVTQDMWDLWIELHGYPHPFLFPGVPFKAISFIMGVFGYEDTAVGPYKLQVLPVVLNGEESYSHAMCEANAELLYTSLGSRQRIE